MFFEILLLFFVANYDEMWIVGGFNGWGGDVMIFVVDYIWEILGIDLFGDEWKIKNCLDWCDEDWGDIDCNNFMESNFSGGNGNIVCGYFGEVIVIFNDEILEYMVCLVVEFVINFFGFYLFGIFNNFDGDEFCF